METAYKLTLLLTRRSDMDLEQFANEWLDLERRQPLVVSGLEKYIFHSSMGEKSPIAGANSAPYDAVIETWWRRKNDAAEWVVSAAFDDNWLPPRQKLLAELPAAVGGEPVTIIEHDEAHEVNPVTVIVLPVAKRNLRFNDFAEHWVGTHSRLALASPGSESRVIRIENTPAPLAPPTRFQTTRYDGVGSLKFASEEALREEFESEYYREVLAPDESRFTDSSVSVAFLGRSVDLT